VGTLTLANDLSFTSGSTWLVDLAGATSDQIVGIVDLNPARVALAVHATPPAWTVGQTWTIAMFTGTRTGTFGGLENGATFTAASGVGEFRINYTDTPGSGAIRLTAVPEPSTLSVAGLLRGRLPALWIGLLVWPPSHRNPLGLMSRSVVVDSPNPVSPVICRKPMWNMGPRLPT